MAAVLFSDLDRFKLINDSLGHCAGDTLLKTVAERLQECVRTDDTVARFSGDEFAIVLNDIRSRSDVDAVIDSVLESFKRPLSLDLGTEELNINTSLGVAHYPQDGRNEQELTKNADAALYDAKESGRKDRSYYSDIVRQNSENSLRFEREMRDGTRRDEFKVYYQSIVSMNTRRLTGMETLVRWNHPERGVLLPNIFLSYAEDSGFIHQLDEFIITDVCASLREWKEASFSLVPVAINLSASRFYRPDFLEKIKASLIASGVGLGYVHVEIIENLALRHREIAIEKLCELKEIGVGVSLDDFGTGNSSRTYL